MSNNKFESLLELLINEENDKAEALFHEIVVEKSRDIYENLADEEVTAESKDEEVKETEASKEEAVKETEESKDEEVKETSEESKDEQVDEVVEIEDEATESETTEEESIEEVGGDATDELVKDISSEEEGEMDGMDKPEMDMDMDKDMDAEKDAEGDVEDRVVDLEDALDELKAEFEAMMGDKKDDMEDKEDESLEVAPELTPEVEFEGKMMAGKKMDKKDMKEYKNPVTANHADGSDAGKSPIETSNKPMNTASAKGIAQGGADEKGRPAPTAQKMSDFENTGGKAKSTSYKKQVSANTADGSDKSAKSPITSSK